MRGAKERCWGRGKRECKRGGEEEKEEEEGVREEGIVVEVVVVGSVRVNGHYRRITQHQPLKDFKDSCFGAKLENLEWFWRAYSGR